MLSKMRSSWALALVLLTGLSPSVRADPYDRKMKLRRLSRKIPARLDTAREQRGTFFRLRYAPATADGNIPLDVMHSWLLELTDAAGAPVAEAALTVAGDMPQHGHGLPAATSVRAVGSGRYRVDGLKFHMPGWWVVEARVRAGGHDETIAFQLLAAGTPSLASLWIGSLPTLAAPPRAAAVGLGAALFKDAGLSRDGHTACVSCHVPDAAFASPRIVRVAGIGPRNVPTLAGVAWQSWFFADGRKASLASQALAPLTSPGEHDLTAAGVAARVRARHREAYEGVFGAVARQSSQAVLENVGRALAAYEATLVPPRSRFDRFVEWKLGIGDEEAGFTQCAERGLALFTGRARCVSCHHGPLFRNGHFHNTGIPARGLDDDAYGRLGAFKMLSGEPARCTECAELTHVEQGNMLLAGAFKTPTLRQIAKTAPYMRGGQLATLRDVVRHYSRAPESPFGETELLPLALRPDEEDALVCFLETL